MKIKSLYAAAAGIILLASCNLNNPPAFDDKDAFVAFDKLSINAPEEGGILKVPVSLVSLAGLDGTVDYEIDAEATKAQEGINYRLLNSSRTLTFSKDAPTQYIEIDIINNDIFTGDLPLTLKLTSSSRDIGANSTCRVVIIDDEHPLMMLFGTYTGKYISYWEATEYDADITISKDDADPFKVWIDNIDPYFASYGYVASAGYNHFYGIVNEEKTEIHIPVGQDLGYSSEKIVIAGIDDPDPDAGNEIGSGGYITVEILDGGARLKFPNAFGVAASDGFWELYLGGIILTKE
jgi:hypothetical protein